MKRLVAWMFVNPKDATRGIIVEGIVAILILGLVGFLVPEPAPWIMLGLLFLIVFNLAVAGGVGR